MPASNRIEDLEALHALIDEALILVSDIKTSDGRSERAMEVLSSALALASDLATVPPTEVGRAGGLKTAERGSEYYREIASKRQTLSGGRKRNPMQ